MEVKLNLFENYRKFLKGRLSALAGCDKNSSSDQICACKFLLVTVGGLSKNKCRKPIKHRGVGGALYFSRGKPKVAFQTLVPAKSLVYILG